MRFYPDRQGDALLRTHLLAALRRLDELLRQAAQTAPLVFGEDAARDLYRGLYMDWDEVQRLLQRDPGASLFPGGERSGGLIASGEEPILQTLVSAFDLTPFDLDILLIALAPEIDLRYRRLFAYLQDDVTRKYPTVDLILHLLCSSPETRLLRRAHFAPDAPLIRHDLLHLEAMEEKPTPPLIARSVRLDEQITNLLLDQPGVDRRLAAFCEWITPAETFDTLPLTENTRRALLALDDHTESDACISPGRTTRSNGERRKPWRLIISWSYWPLMWAGCWPRLSTSPTR
jgi:hypothetical protein